MTDPNLAMWLSERPGRSCRVAVELLEDGQVVASGNHPRVLELALMQALALHRAQMAMAELEDTE